MKILHAVLSEGFYGSERYCIELATAQAQAGHRVMVLIQGTGSDCARAFRRDIDATNRAAADRPSGGSIDLITIPRAAPAFLHRSLATWILHRRRPDIVHTHLNPAARRVGRTAQRLGIPHVATLHIRYEAREHADCDGLICGAAWQRTAIGREFGGEAVTVWPWLSEAVHASLARLAPGEVSTLRHTWNANDDVVVFGSIGRLMPEKGTDILVQAFRSAFPPADKSARLVLIGDGPQASELRRLAAGDGRIILLGAQPDIAPCYVGFDVYVSASRFEPFGLTILEAMDAGCTLVVTRTEGPRDFLRHAPVLWAEPNDVAALAAQLRAAAATGRKRRRYDLSPFTRSSAVAAIEELYRKVLANRRLPA
jgi:glycosyltransferase involved in cell wall biosynthesis